MFNVKKLFICFILCFVLTSSCIFATDNPTTMSLVPNEINEDLYIYDTDSYSISDNVNGNVFASTMKLVINPRSNGGHVSGDIFAIASELSIQSDVTYSNNKDTNGNYIIDVINSKSVIDGNIYALSDVFTLEAGSEINGDLYVSATTVNIEQDAVIDGNIYITAENVNFNGKLTGSAYVSTNNFNMTYSASISRDIYIDAQNATLSGTIYRNAYISFNIDVPDGIVKGKIITSTYADKTPFLYSAVLGLTTFLVYVLGVILLIKRVAPNYIAQVGPITFKNAFASLAIGMLSFFVVFLGFVALLLTSIGVTLALALFVAYLLILVLSFPIFILSVANMLKNNLNIYLKVIIISSVLYIISLIPVLGSAIMFITFILGLGKILLQLFKHKQ